MQEAASCCDAAFVLCMVKCLGVGLAEHGNDAELLPETKRIPVKPIFNDFAMLVALHGGAAYGDLFARRGNQAKR